MVSDDLKRMVEREREMYGGHTGMEDVPGGMSATGVDDPVPDEEYGDDPADIQAERRLEEETRRDRPAPGESSDS